MEPKVLISILTFNDTKEVLGCLKSLKNLNYKNYKVMVTNNNSGENTSIIKEQFPNIIFNDLEKNRGFTGGHNVALYYAIENNFDYIHLLNPDLEIDNNFLKELVNTAESDPKIGIVSGNIYDYYNRKKLLTSGGYLSFVTGIGYESKRPKNNQIQELTDPHEYFDGCSLLFKASMIKDIGAYDERYFLYESADPCIYAMRAGYRIIHNPNSKVYHKLYGSAEGKKSPKAMFYITRNRHLFIKKFFPKRYPLFLLTTIPVFLIQSLLFLKRKQPELIPALIKANFKGLFI